MSDLYAKACAGKRHYRSERRATDAAKKTQRDKGVKMNAYPCPFCKNKWVVGSTYPQYGKAARRESELAESMVYGQDCDGGHSRMFIA